MPATQTSIVRRMDDHRPRASKDAELSTYIRTEYAGDGVPVLEASARAGRGTPASPDAREDRKVRGVLARVGEALAAALAKPGGA